MSVIVRCPRCMRLAYPHEDLAGGRRYYCGDCERGDGVDGVRGVAVALGPLTFSREEAEEAQATRRSAREAWNVAAFDFHDACRHGGLKMRAFYSGADWQALAHEAGLGRVDRPAATAYPAEAS